MFFGCVGVCSAKYTNKKLVLRLYITHSLPGCTPGIRAHSSAIVVHQVTSRLMANGCGHPTAGREPQKKSWECPELNCIRDKGTSVFGVDYKPL